MSDETVRVPAQCHEEVTRKGHLEPCEKPAVAMRIDPTDGKPYPVCIKHTRADMVPLRALVDAAERPERCSIHVWTRTQQERDEDKPFRCHVCGIPEPEANGLPWTPAPVGEPNVYGEGNTGPDLSDRLIALVDEWEAEIDEHTKAGEFGIAEGLRVAMEAVHALTVSPAPLSSPRRTRDEGTEDEAKAFKRGWIDSAVHHATCNGCGTGPLRHDIPDYRPRAARLAGEDDRHG